MHKQTILNIIGIVISKQLSEKVLDHVFFTTLNVKRLRVSLPMNFLFKVYYKKRVFI